MRAQCCICAELFVNNDTNIAATPCGHVFHEHCLARWMLSSKTCPSCRKKVPERGVIPKLFFDIAEEEDGEPDPEKLSNELQTLRGKVSELKQQRKRDKEENEDLRSHLKKKEEALDSLGQLLRKEQDNAAAQQRMLQHYETQQQVAKEERQQFIRAQRKLTELKHVDSLISGSMQDCEEVLQQYSCGDRGSVLQLAKMSAILKREYEKIKGEKRALKEQLDIHKKSSYTATRELSVLKNSHKQLQEHLSRSEEDLKQAEQTTATLKAKLAKLQYARKHPAHTSGSFLETPKAHKLSDDTFTTETPKLALNAEAGKDVSLPCVTPKISRPSGSGLINLMGEGNGGGEGLNQSFDLFEESPQTQVRKTCMENNMRVVKISSAATKTKPLKRVHSEDVDDCFPLATLNIMKKRDKPGQLLGSTVIRKDYNGLGGTSSFTQPLGAPKFSAFKPASKYKRTIKPMKKITNQPPLPTLDGFVDLTSKR